MVAARKLEKQLIEVHLLHKIEGAYPDVPVAEGVDFDGLVQPDREAGDEPFFITLPLGEHDQISRNNRRYVGDVATNAIHDAIQNRSIDGQLGHTAEDRRGWEFKLPGLYWVGSLIDSEGVVWGKAYVPRTHMELREFYRIKIKTNGNVGTSLEGMGYQEWNDETEMWDITELTVHRIDAVAASGVGIQKAGSMPPKVTKEQKQPVREAEAGSIAVGDWVQWDNRNNQLMRGKVNTVWDDGEVEVPYSDSPPLLATAENPLCRMDIFAPHYDTGEWRRTDWQEIQYVRDVTKIEMLPEIAQRDNGLSEGQDNEETPIQSETEGETQMVDTKTKEKDSNADETLTEAQQLQTQLTEMQANFDEAQRKARQLEATLINVRKGLSLDENADVVGAVQAIVAERQTLQDENAALLETAIAASIVEHAKIISEAQQSESAIAKALAGTVSTLIRQRVQAAAISKKAEVEGKVKDVVSKEDVQAMLKELRGVVMGPNVETPLGSNETDGEYEAITY